MTAKRNKRMYELSADAVCGKDAFIAFVADIFHLATEEEAGNIYDAISAWVEPLDQFTIQDSNADFHGCRRKCDILIRSIFGPEKGPQALR